MTGRIGAVHLGADILAVAACGPGAAPTALPVEGSSTPPAYLLADSTGRLYTAGIGAGRSGLGVAVRDVRDIVGHRQIMIAGAQWPAADVFRARLHNAVLAVTEYLGARADLLALVYPDPWPDHRIDEFCDLVTAASETEVEPIPESISLAGYCRATGLVPPGTGATIVYSDRRTVLVVAVHADDDLPTESIDVPITGSMDADTLVLDTLGAARSIGADTATVVLTGSIVADEHLRLTFHNQLGKRLLIPEEPLHAAAIGAAVLIADEEGQA